MPIRGTFVLGHSQGNSARGSIAWPVEGEIRPATGYEIGNFGPKWHRGFPLDSQCSGYIFLGKARWPIGVRPTGLSKQSLKTQPGPKTEQVEHVNEQRDQRRDQDETSDGVDEGLQTHGLASPATVCGTLRLRVELCENCCQGEDR